MGIKGQNKTLRKSVAFTHRFVRCDVPVLAAMLRCIELRVAPSLRYQERQVVDPIGFTNPTWIDNVAQVVFRIRDNKIGVGD